MPSREDAPVVARWEWRMFFAGGLLPRLAAKLPPETGPVEESDEIYVISAASPQNVKVRRGTLEIKTLECAAEGLERWRPTLKAPWPLDAEATHALGDALALRVMRVHKRRRRIEIEGCTAEVALLAIDGAPWVTIAIEDPRPDRVRRAVTALGLDPLVNLSYPAALRRIAGLR